MLTVEPRIQTASFLRYIIPLLSFALTILVGMLLFWLLGKNPLSLFPIFFFHPLNDLYSIGELFLKSAPLMLIATGLAVGFRASIWNIGAEGQYILGAIFSTAMALYFSHWPIYFLLPSMVVFGMLGGMFWALIPAFLRTRFHANEILVSLMLVYIAELLVSWLVFNVWRDPSGYGFPQTKLFEESATLPILLEGTRLNYGIFLVLVILVCGYVLTYRSYLGYQLNVSGKSQPAARYAGFSHATMIWVGLLTSGALAGLAGMLEVAGPAGQLTDHISSGYGFSAIIVAFIGRLHPVGIFLASLVMAMIYIGGEQAQQYLAFPASIGMIFQGLLLIFLAGGDFFLRYRIRF